MNKSGLFTHILTNSLYHSFIWICYAWYQVSFLISWCWCISNCMCSIWMCIGILSWRWYVGALCWLFLGLLVRLGSGLRWYPRSSCDLPPPGCCFAAFYAVFNALHQSQISNRKYMWVEAIRPWCFRWEWRQWFTRCGDRPARHGSYPGNALQANR